ncbi:L,D-transpeptidase family protein [Thiocystis violacea]|uniref:L,D-transpeptidase family protein n=1 Tax=Thiocystis violacea TaxID=13725 RepID=UPI001F5B04EB|nr:L,D-transpeptidase family protein [Thiocystis violacea]
MLNLTLALVVAALLVWAYAHWPPVALPLDASADHLLVLKSERKLRLYRGRELLREYRVSLGFAPRGAKEREGDGKTPEGRYVIDYRNPNSRFYRSLHIAYPTATEVARAQAKGVSPGGMIMIHGLRNDRGFWGRLHRLRDWTAGCIAVTNAEMAEIWRLVPDGTPIEIRP